MALTSAGSNGVNSCYVSQSALSPYHPSATIYHTSSLAASSSSLSTILSYGDAMLRTIGVGALHIQTGGVRRYGKHGQWKNNGSILVFEAANTGICQARFARVQGIPKDTCNAVPRNGLDFVLVESMTRSSRVQRF